MFKFSADKSLLANKTILVTGANTGIGKAAAIAYGQHGANVILLGRNTESLESCYDEMTRAGCPEPAIYTLDLLSTEEQHYFDLRDAIGKEFGKLDGLLHNASLLSDRKPIAQQNWQQWQDVMQVNVNSAFLLCKTLMPLFEEAETASILLTSSSVGRKGRAFWGSYAVSKFATEGLMQVMADELENTSNIRVNSINPGATNTAMRRAAYPGEAPDNNPTAEQIMPLYLFLMSDESKALTGTISDAQKDIPPQKMLN